MIAAARDRGLGGSHERIGIVALTGNMSDSAAIERNKGLTRAVEESPEADLLQMVPARWNRDQARRKAHGLIKRYPDCVVLWGANDPMALGGIDAARTLGLDPGRNFLVGGIDWNRPALEAIRKGGMVASIGGHFMEGGWVLVMLHDLFHGRDFADDEGADLRSEMGVLDAGNIATYIDRFSNSDWDRIDFTRFSKILTPAVERYDFSLNAVLEQL